MDWVAAAGRWKLGDRMDRVAREHDSARFLSRDPPILAIDDFLTDEECVVLIELGRAGELGLSTTAGVLKHLPQWIRTPWRTSRTGFLETGRRRDPAVVSIDERISRITGLASANSGEYQVLQYVAPDEYYRLHSDFMHSAVGAPG